MFVNIITIAVGFYIALVAENFTNLTLQYFLEKHYRQKIQEASKLFSEAMLMAQPTGNDEDAPPVN